MSLGIICFILAFIILVITAAFIEVSRRTHQFPCRVKGKIISMNYVKDNSSSEHKKAFGIKNRHKVIVTFMYTLDDMDFQATTKIPISERIARYKIWSDCTVRYNPENPKEAIISEEDSLRVVSIVLSIIAIVLLLGRIIVIALLK